MIIDYILIFFFTVTSLWMGWVFLCHEKPSVNTIAMAVLMVVLATGTYWSIQTYKGYPTEFVEAKNRVLLWADVQRPTDDFEGAIYIWVLDPEREVSTVENLLKLNFKKVPRAYKMPYSEKAAREARDAVDKLKEGMGITVNLRRDAPTGDGEEAREFNLEVEAIDPYKILRKNNEE